VDSEALKTCLYERHVALGAKVEPFAGFLMPIQYQGIVIEHNAVRQNVGVFDVSHMGEILVRGKDAMDYIDYVFSNEIRTKAYGQVTYGFLPNFEGGVVDDLLVYKVSDEEFFLVVNASNIAKDYAWLVDQTEGFDVLVNNQSDFYGEVALQGPNAEATMKELFDLDLSGLGFFTFGNYEVLHHPVLISRTGYTGEDGFEIYGDPVEIVEIWDAMMKHQIQPCGLGCRDTLRFEAALPLYGHELSDTISPFEAGFGSFVQLQKPKMIALELWQKQKEEGVKRKVVGIELTEKAIPRQGYEVFVKDTPIGVVTTGYLSISTGKPVCMALIDAAYSKKDTLVEIQIRAKRFPGFVRNKQFYKKNYKPKGESL